MNINSELAHAGSQNKKTGKIKPKLEEAAECPGESNEINLKKPFIVLRKYQDRMVSSNARKLWKETGVNRNIEKHLEEELKNMYER